MKLKNFDWMNLINWIAFGFIAASAGANWNTNPVAFIGMFIMVLIMVLRDYRRGLDEGSAIANEVWKESMDRLFADLKNKDKA